MGIDNTWNSAAFCALLTEDPDLWHTREGMSFVCLAGPGSDPFAVERSPNHPGRSWWVFLPWRDFAQAWQMCLPGVSLLTGEDVCVCPGLWGREREGGLVEGRSALPQPQHHEELLMGSLCSQWPKVHEDQEPETGLLWACKDLWQAVDPHLLCVCVYRQCLHFLKIRSFTLCLFSNIIYTCL